MGTSIICNSVKKTVFSTCNYLITKTLSHGYHASNLSYRRKCSKMDCDFKSCSWHQPHLQIYGILQICFRTPKLFCRAGDAKKYDLAHQCDSLGSSGWRNIDTGRFIHQNGRSGSNTYPVRSRYFC